MKKILVIVWTIALAISLFAGCSNDEQLSTNPDISVPTTNPSTPSTDHSTTEPSIPSTTAPSTTEPTEEEVDILAFPEVETSAENIEVYRAEVQARLMRENFFTPEEEDVLVKLLSSNDGFGKKHVVVKTARVVEFNELYSSVNVYYFPVIFREGSSLILWYTTEGGSVLLEKLVGYWNDSNVVGRLHQDDGYDVVMESSYNYRMTWDEETSRVTIWQFGQIEDQYQIPSGSVYCGLSAFEGHIFRYGTEVYALQIGTWFTTTVGELKRIATGVSFVIACDYSFASDPWSQPLFLMEDGTVKCYISWEGDQDAPADDPSHLVDLRYEGGW